MRIVQANEIPVASVGSMQILADALGVQHCHTPRCSRQHSNREMMHD